MKNMFEYSIIQSFIQTSQFTKRSSLCYEVISISGIFCGFYMDIIVCCVTSRFAAELEIITRKGLFREIKEKSYDTAFPLKVLLGRSETETV